MSTILDALRKVERERDPSQDRMVESPTVVAASGRRLPMWVIAIAAFVGFGIGGVLSWQQAQVATTTEVAALPAVPPPPAIAVPRPPVPGAEAPAVLPQPETEQQAAAPPTPPQAAADAVAVAPPVPPAAASAIEDPKAAADRILAAIEKEDSVLEPSPFSAPREEPPAPAAPASQASRPAPPPPAPSEPDQVAAVGPAVAPFPDAPVQPLPEMVEPEAEPEATPEVLVDTGRSPPGAPKVALSFLQWSADPAKRFAFVSIDGGATQRVREGEVTSGLTVAAITPEGIQFKREGTTFVIRPRH